MHTEDIVPPTSLACGASVGLMSKDSIVTRSSSSISLSRGTCTLVLSATISMIGAELSCMYAIINYSGLPLKKII